MPQPKWHLTPSGDGWKIKRTGADRAAAITETKAEAVALGREIAKNGLGQLIIHGTDGVIQTEWTYGPDPTSSKG